jgi:hypothetical protein
MSFTILITSRRGPDAERQENLLAVLAGFAGVAPAILVEQDAMPRLALPPGVTGVARLFAHNPGPLHKGWGLNVAARHARTPWLVFADADLLAPGALQRLQAHQGAAVSMIKPYLRQIELDPADSDRLRRGEVAPESFAAEAAVQAPLCAGLFAMRAETFWRLGGWDERFGEPAVADAAFAHKIERMRVPALVFDEAPALHLWQSPAPIPATASASAEALLQHLRVLPEAAWERSLEVQGQLAGHREKYRPLP